MGSTGKKVIGFFAALSLLACFMYASAMSTVTNAVTCGIALVSPVDEAQDIIGNVKEGTQDTFFNLFAPEDAKDRKKNAALIVKIGEDRGFSPNSIGIAIATAIQESNLKNLPFQGAKNDHKSLGLFQQQPPWWGTPEQILDPSYSTNAFYDALQKVPDRDTRPMLDVAIQVQIPNERIYRATWPANREVVAMSIVKDNFAGDGKIGDNCTDTVESDTGWVLPLSPKVYQVASPFGWRCLFVCKNHDGVDLSAAAQTPIFAAHDGIVTYKGYYGAYGNFVQIDHGDGVVTEYGHMIRFADDYANGDKVRSGQVIGYVGTTGRSTGEHLHFNTKINGKYVDPVPYMMNLGVDIKGGAR